MWTAFGAWNNTGTQFGIFIPFTLEQSLYHILV